MDAPQAIVRDLRRCAPEVFSVIQRHNTDYLAAVLQRFGGSER